MRSPKLITESNGLRSTMMSERNRSLSSGCCGWCFTVACAHDLSCHSAGIFTGMPWFSVITSALHAIADEHDAHAAQHEVAGREPEDQDVGGDEQAEADVVPVLPRDGDVLERDLDREPAERAPTRSATARASRRL